MRTVAVERVQTLHPQNFWAASLADLAREAAAPLASGERIEALFCAAPSAAFVERQADFASIVADRISITPDTILTVDAADSSAAAALHCAWRHLKSGGAASALVVAAAKVSDLSESERHALMDRALDQEVEVAAGLGFSAQAGLLAGHYCRAHQGNAELLAETTTANLAAWTNQKGVPGPSAGELRRDLVVAPPLLRSDFAQLLDGASAILLRAGDAAEGWTVDAVGSGSDTVALWERADPLTFASVERAVLGSLAGSPAPRWLEIDAGVSIVQRLSEDAIARVTKSKPDLVNRCGGAQGRGRVWGASLFYQLQDIVESGTPHSSVLAVSVAGLGSRGFATRLSRRNGT